MCERVVNCLKLCNLTQSQLDGECARVCDYDLTSQTMENCATIVRKILRQLNLLSDYNLSFSCHSTCATEKKAKLRIELPIILDETSNSFKFCFDFV